MVEKASGPNLFEFEIKASDDPAKDAHALVHEPCGRVLCDVEPGDDLHTLVSVAANHPCDKRRSDSPAPEPCELRGCMRDGYDAEHVNRVFGKIRDDCGIGLVCVWDLYDSVGVGGTPSSMWTSAPARYSSWPATCGAGSMTIRTALNHPGTPATWGGDIAEFCLADLPWHDGWHNYAVRDDHHV